METKLHRYMQRIQKIFKTPTKTVSPLKPTKSPLKCKTNQLDQYLKYQLSVKIIGNFIKKHQEQYVNMFFNLIRKSEFRQKERIYKFIAIQKKEMKVDLGVAAKIMVFAIKQIYKNRFTRFIQGIVSTQQKMFRSTEEQPSFKKKIEREDTMKSAILLRTSSRHEVNNYKEVSEWNYDGQSSKGKEPNYDRYQKMKGFVLKTLVRIIYSKVKKSQEEGVKKIQQHSIAVNQRKKYEIKIIAKESKSKDSENWKLKEENYKKELSNLQQTLAREREEMKLNLSFQKHAQNEVKPVENFSHISSLQIERLFGMMAIKVKTNIISQIKQSSIQHSSTKGKEQYRANYLSKALGISCLSNFYMNLIRKALYQLREVKDMKRERQMRYQRGINLIVFLIEKKVLKNYQFLLRKLSTREVLQQLQLQNLEQIKTIQIKNSSIPDFIDVRSSNRSPFDLEEGSNSIVKLNFYSFVDKVFRLILIVSKMLIPLKEAFVQIDLYASYSYRIEESFKVVYQNRLRQVFENLKFLKQRHTQSVFAEQKIVNILDKVVKQKYIEPFSYIKISSREKDLKIKIFPVRSTIVNSSRLFIEERNIYFLHSQDYWSKVKENKFQQPGNPEKESTGKKRSNTSF